MEKNKTEENKSKTIKETQKNGDIYVYEVTTRYDSVKKYNVITSKHLIGKIQKGTDEIVPTRPKRKKNIEENGIYKLRTGMIDIIAHVSEKSHVHAEVMKAVENDAGLGEKMLTLAWYSFATDGNTWPNIRNWCISIFKSFTISRYTNISGYVS